MHKYTLKLHADQARNSKASLSKTFPLYPSSYIFLLSKQMLHIGRQGPWLDKRLAMSLHPRQQWPREMGLNYPPKLKEHICLVPANSC